MTLQSQYNNVVTLMNQYGTPQEQQAFQTHSMLTSLLFDGNAFYREMLHFSQPFLLRISQKEGGRKYKRKYQKIKIN